jgi:hypothetical protein
MVLRVVRMLWWTHMFKKEIGECIEEVALRLEVRALQLLRSARRILG